jgi:hypothetical protein
MVMVETKYGDHVIFSRATHLIIAIAENVRYVQMGTQRIAYNEWKDKYSSPRDLAYNEFDLNRPAEQIKHFVPKH